MRIATWNVNSIRTRLDHVTNWLKESQVDVLCVQETKVTDDAFPRDPIADLGYHIYVSGQKSYNGVAIFSRSPLSHVSTGFAAVLGESVSDLDEQKRVITGAINGIQIVNLYVPNGSSVGSEKYAYKLRWLETLHLYLKALGTGTQGAPSTPNPSLSVGISTLLWKIAIFMMQLGEKKWLWRPIWNGKRCKRF